MDNFFNKKKKAEVFMGYRLFRPKSAVKLEAPCLSLFFNSDI